MSSILELSALLARSEQALPQAIYTWVCETPQAARLRRFDVLDASVLDVSVRIDAYRLLWSAKALDDRTRVEAMTRLVCLNAPAIAGALIQVLMDEQEPVQLRCDATDLIGGSGVAEAIPALLSLLEDASTPAELLFWSLYAVANLRATQAIPIITRFVGDLREVQLAGFGPASLDDEARWALAVLGGGGEEGPEWERRAMARNSGQQGD